MRNSFDIPIIAIEPALKQVINTKHIGSTLVMATKGTIKSVRFLELYHNFSNENMIVESFPSLADLIEQDKPEEIKNYLKEHLNYENVSNVVLGCTHYPLIKKEIKEVLGDVNFYDGSVGVAKRLKQVVQDINLRKTKIKIEFIDSSNNINKEKRFYKILGE